MCGFQPKVKETSLSDWFSANLPDVWSAGKWAGKFLRIPISLVTREIVQSSKCRKEHCLMFIFPRQTPVVIFFHSDLKAVEEARRFNLCSDNSALKL